MNKQEVVTIVTVTGEYIGKFIDESADKITTGNDKIIKTASSFQSD